MSRMVFSTGAMCLILVCGRAIGARPMNVDLPIAQPLTVAYSPDGKQVAVGGLESFGNAPIDGVVQLVDAETGAKQSLLRHPGRIVDKDGSGGSGSQNRILALAYSPDGKTLAVAADMGLKLWNPIDGQELLTLLGYGIDERSPVRVTSVDFSPDGKLLAVARSPIELWDATARKPLRQIDVHGDTTVKFFGAGARLVSASYQNQVHVWNVADGKELGRIHAQMGPLYGVAIDPKEGHLAAVGEGGEKLWKIEEAASGEWRFVDEARLRGHSMAPVRQVAFSPDGRWLATAGDDGALVMYDANTRQIIGTLLTGGPFALSPDGKSIAVAQFREERRSNARPPATRPKGGTRFTVWNVSDLLNADRLSEQARAAAAEMVQTLTAARPDRRLIQGAVAVLSGPQAEAATPTLVDALANPAVNEKHLLLFPLGRIAVHDAKARTALIDAISSHPEVDVRSMAAAMLAELPRGAGKEAVPVLVEAALNDASPHVSSSAARALQRLDPAVYKTVTEKLQARGPVVAKVERRDGKIFYQGRSLEEWIKRLSVSYIPNEIFGRPRPDEPLAAIRAFGPEAVPVLIATLKSDQWPLRQAAAAGLETLGPSAAPAIDPLLAIISAAKDDDLTMAVASAAALAAILKPANEPPAKLLAMLHSEKPATRLGAACAIAQIQPSYARALQTLKAALESSQRRRDWRFDVHLVGAFTPQPTLEWLIRTLADPDTPRDKRIQTVLTLQQLGEGALPALPTLLTVIGEDDDFLTHEVEVAIQRIGPESIPAVRDALTAATSERTRKQLSSTLWGIGEVGRRALTELLTKDDAESLWWWAALTNHVGDPVAMQYQMAANETLQKLGQAVSPPTRPTGVPQVRGPANAPGSTLFVKPNAKWLVKTLTDGDIPKQLRVQVSGELGRVPTDEVLPELPTLLSAIGRDDPSIGYPIQKVVMRLGSQAVPAVRDALSKAGSDDERRRLLSTLHGLGDEGRRAAQELVQHDPRLQQALSSKSGPPRSNSDVTRQIPPEEQKAIAAAEQNARPLTNGDFHAGLDGWRIEDGASSFHSFRNETGWWLTTFGDRKDANTGRLYQCFKVPDDAVELRFKLGGGANAEQTYVALWRKDRLYRKLSARNSNTDLVEGRWDLTPLRREVVTLEIVDRSTSGWGFIGIQDFRIVVASESQPAREPTTSPTGAKSPSQTERNIDPYHELQESPSRAARLTYERYVNLIKLQEWNDASGKHSTLAKYIGHDPQLKWVKLEVVRGEAKDRAVKETTVPFDKLSATCQSRVRQIAVLQSKLDDYLAGDGRDIDSDEQSKRGHGPMDAGRTRRTAQVLQVVKAPKPSQASDAAPAGNVVERIPVSISANFTPVDRVVTTTWPAGGSIKLSSTRSPDLLKEPAYRGNSQKYGRLQLGTREDKTYHIVYDVLDGNIVGLYFDRNQNRDLTDDNGPLEIRGRRPMAAEIAVPLDQLIPELRKTGDFHIVVLTNEQLWKMERASHYSQTQLEGRINIAGNSYLAYIGERGVMGLNDADFTNDGIYVDLNDDGKIQSEEEYISNQSTVRGDGKEYSFDIQW